MTIWIVLAGILFMFWLLGRIRVRAAASYSQAGFFLNVRIGPKEISILPSKAKGKVKKPKQTKKTAQNPDGSPEGAKPKPGIADTVSTVLRYLPLVGEAAGRLKRKIRIDDINLHVIWGAPDPADAAKGYGMANAVMGILWPAVEHNFKVKEYDLGVDVDYEREKPEVNADACVSITVGQIIALVVILGTKALKIYLGIRREKSENTENEKAVQA